MNEMPAIAIVHANTLAAIGLAALVEQAMPMARPQTFASFEALSEADHGQFVHYFVAADVLMQHARFFVERQHRTFVLVEGARSSLLPAEFRTIDVGQSREDFVRAFVALHAMAHGPHGPMPAQVVEKKMGMPHAMLTPRETEVLRLVVKGMTNKMIAAELGIALTTAISHRKNLASKLRTKSVSAMTVYAVSHGLVKIEDI